MDLGIAGRWAIVSAGGRGLGRGCAEALAANGVHFVLDGRDRAVLERTAAEIRAASGVEVVPVAADITRPEGRAAVLAVRPDPDILVDNAGGPPPGDLREWGRRSGSRRSAPTCRRRSGRSGRRSIRCWSGVSVGS